MTTMLGTVGVLVAIIGALIWLAERWGSGR